MLYVMDMSITKQSERIPYMLHVVSVGSPIPFQDAE